MAHIDEHAKDCLDELGEEFREVHIWLDELFKILGPKHRDARHHRGGVEEVRKKWGDRAARAAEIHIIKDCKKVPTVQEAQMWSLFGGECDNKGSEIVEK